MQLWPLLNFLSILSVLSVTRATEAGVYFSILQYKIDLGKSGKGAVIWEGLGGGEAKIILYM